MDSHLAVPEQNGRPRGLTLAVVPRPKAVLQALVQGDHVSKTVVPDSSHSCNVRTKKR